MTSAESLRGYRLCPECGRRIMKARSTIDLAIGLLCEVALTLGSAILLGSQYGWRAGVAFYCLLLVIDRREKGDA